MTDLGDERWTQIRYDYEHTGRPIVDICAEHGISANTLRDRVRRWDWTKRRTPIPRQGPPAAAAPKIEMETEASARVADVSALTEPNTDPAAIAPRLQGAVARVLPAIEAIIARLGAQPLAPRELEQTARALGALTRTLRELNALLSQQQTRTVVDYDDMPEDLDAFRNELAQRIDALLAEPPEEDCGGEAGDTMPR